MKMSFRWYGQSDPVSLQNISQIPGMHSIVSAVYDVKPGEVWPEESIAKMVKECEENNLVFDVVPVRERTAAFALNSAVLGLLGFLTTLAVSPLVDYIQANGNTFLGFNIFAQQLLAIISAFIIVMLVIYYYTYCKRVLEE